MQFLVFIIAYPFLYFHSSLSHFFLAVMAFIGIILSAIGKKVVRANLALALPHLSDKERVVIEKNHIAIYVTCLWK
jgi:KDO2-lipid IV(A) lauroyltransferase